MKKTISIIICICLVALSLASCKAKEEESSADISDSVKYTYDSAYSFDDATIRAYKDLCKAVITGDGEVRINSGFIDDVLQLFYTSFPLSALVKSIEPADAVYKIEYKSEEAHNDALQFLEKIKEIKSDCAGSTKTEYTINLYNKIASSVKISENASISCYETVMKGEGTSFSYSNMFEYLLEQNDINAYHILCEDMGGRAKAISAAELDGKLYYFDLFSEFNDNGGKILKYFGMTSDDCSQIGLQNFIYSNKETSADASDLRFQACRFCSEWEINDENLVVTRSDGEIVQVAL